MTDKKLTAKPNNGLTFAPACLEAELSIEQSRWPTTRARATYTSSGPAEAILSWSGRKGCGTRTRMRKQLYVL